ncbi:hypothetical protein [Tamlana sp. I1]|uniref:hypothetical protein n=1 Tax=Tamlana sp. I1 TaxID=2762061 RepID=UPI0018901CD1|nr:hypothetical protein [Tamlana sp. I1]
MTIQDLVGEYSIIGSNQNEDQNTYKGTLHLTLDQNERIKAKWIINNNQIQLGNGFFKDNILVINFHYLGENDAIFKGVVVYKCLSKNVLEGFWSEEQGDPEFLGTEQCFRTNTQNEFLN